MEKTTKVENWVAPQSGQRALPHVALYPTIFSGKKHSCHASALFARIGTVRLLAVPQIGTNDEREAI